MSGASAVSPHWIVGQLEVTGHAMTPLALMRAWNENQRTLGACVIDEAEVLEVLMPMELDQLVYLHRDSSAGNRHSKEWGGIVLVAKRG
jgi:hypothetical protein